MINQKKTFFDIFINILIELYIYYIIQILRLSKLERQRYIDEFGKQFHIINPIRTNNRDRIQFFIETKGRKDSFTCFIPHKFLCFTRIRYLATLWEVKSLQVRLSFHQLFFVDDIGNLDIYEMLRATLWKPFNAQKKPLSHSYCDLNSAKRSYRDFFNYSHVT